MEKFTRETSHAYNDDVLPPKNDEIPEVGSPGNETGTRTELRKTQYVGRHETSARLIEISEMLTFLAAQQNILRWAAVPCSSHRRQIEELDVWAVPDRAPSLNRVRANGWCFLDKDRQRRRHALVCEVQLLNNSIVYWLELECTANSVKSFLFTIDGGDLQTAITRILRACVEVRGIWGRAKDLISASGLKNTLAWQHSYIKETGRLNHHRALKAMNNVSSSGAGSTEDPERVMHDA